MSRDEEFFDGAGSVWSPHIRCPVPEGGEPSGTEGSSSRVDTDFHRDSGKPRVDLVPPGFILGVGRILDFGAGKYGDRNWEEHADSWEWSRLIASALRHILAWEEGEDLDPESGEHHLYHAGCNLAMLTTLIECERGVDDRTLLK